MKISARKLGECLILCSRERPRVSPDPTQNGFDAAAIRSKRPLADHRRFVTAQVTTNMESAPRELARGPGLDGGG